MTYDPEPVGFVVVREFMRALQVYPGVYYEPGDAEAFAALGQEGGSVEVYACALVPLPDPETPDVAPSRTNTPPDVL